MPKIRLLLSDPTSIGCEVFAQALIRAEFEVVSCTSTVEGIVTGVSVHSPDIVLISTVLEDGSLAGFSALRECRVSNPELKAVMLLDKYDTGLITSAFRGGAHGVFMRAQPFNLLCRCIRAVNDGQVWADSRDLHLLLQMIQTTAPLRIVNATGTRLLSTRDEQVVSLVAQGLSNREIGQKLGLSENTVKNYLFRVFDKLGVSSRVELALYALHAKQNDAA